jgi:hypothetical protein
MRALIHRVPPGTIDLGAGYGSAGRAYAVTSLGVAARSATSIDEGPI